LHDQQGFHDKLKIMKAPIQIRREDVVADIRALSELMGVSITDAVSQVVKDRLLSEQQIADKKRAERNKRADKILKQIRSLPRVGVPLTDDDLYDEYGLPK
jgi:hypothetical protein